MPNKQRTFGQFETPPDVADLLLSLCVRRASDAVLDPSCGNGSLLLRSASWQAWLGGDEQVVPAGLYGVELDEMAVETARRRLPQAHILHQNFFTMQPDASFDAIVGNPPYTRAEWFDHLREAALEQLRLFELSPGNEVVDRNEIIPRHLWKSSLSRRAGLHAYFILHGTQLLREGGRFGFVLPNNWLDVGYGDALKQFLLEQFRIIALVESTAERWFSEARVNTCLLIMEKCSHLQEREAQLVRFVQLRQPLSRLLPYALADRGRFSAVEALGSRLLPAHDLTSAALRIRVIPQTALRPREKWSLLWRAPTVYRQARRQATRRGLAPLKEWASIQRGFTTGANAFFYLDAQTVEKWGIEQQFRQPLLKSLRTIDCLAPEIAGDMEVLSISPTDSLANSGAGAYVRWGEGEGFHERSTCRARQPWYAFPHQEAAKLVLGKGIWERHLAPLLERPLLIDQQLYRLAPYPGISIRLAAALLNSSWAALQLELQGRVNFGEGVLWLATYEVENLLLPDPRRLAADAAAHLEDCFDTLCRRQLAGDMVVELARADRKPLDDAVFQVIGLSTTEATIIQETLLERIAARHSHVN